MPSSATGQRRTRKNLTKRACARSGARSIATAMQGRSPPPSPRSTSMQSSVDGIAICLIWGRTAMTGAGKTAWALYVAACVALGRPIGRHGVERGSVCYLAGENPTDVQMRWIAMAEHMDFDDKNIDVHFVVGKFKVEDIKLAVAAKAQESGREFALVFVDTSATYFPGDDEN